jgi:hypothetical protein
MIGSAIDNRDSDVESNMSSDLPDAEVQEEKRRARPRGLPDPALRAARAAWDRDRLYRPVPRDADAGDTDPHLLRVALSRRVAAENAEEAQYEGVAQSAGCRLQIPQKFP